MADPTPEEVLGQLERRRRERWAVAALLVVAVVASLALLVVDDAVARLGPWVAGAFVVVSLLFAGSVVAQERRAAQAVRALLGERERAGALRARVGALETVLAAVRDVSAAERIEDVFDRLLSAALELTEADAGTTWLRVGDRLTVATARGVDAPAPGTTEGLDDGVPGQVVRTGEPLVTGRGGEWSGAAASSVVAAPLRLPDRVVGVLVLERRGQAPPFDAVDRTAVALFAEQAALALRGATRLDAQRERADELERDLRERAALAATVVHDLKAPLSAVAGYAQLLRDRAERLDADRRRSLCDEVLAESQRLEDLLEGLQAAAVAESGAGPRRRDVDLGELARSAARTAEGLAHRQGHEREVTVEAPASVVVRADPHALRRVLVNLVDNAVSCSPPGSPVRLHVRTEADQAVVGVRDHGPGVPEEEHGRIFQPFVSGRGGTGLGLYVVRTLVEAHGGQVRLRGGEGGGTLAEVRLPGATTGAHAGAVAAARTHRSG